MKRNKSKKTNKRIKENIQTIAMLEKTSHSESSERNTQLFNSSPAGPRAILGELSNEIKEEYTAYDLCRDAPEAVIFLLTPLIPAKCVCFLTGSSDCNKSTFLRQLAIAIAFTHPHFLGFPLNVRNKKVLLVITEDDAENVSVYIKRTLGELGLNENSKNIFFIFTTENVPGKIRDFIAKTPVDAVIIDTWTDTYSGDLNSSNKVRENLKIYRKMIQRYPCAIICLHHTGKRAEERNPSKNSMLGSQGIEATARVVLELRRIDNLKRGLTILKGNYTPDTFKDKTFTLELDANTFILKNIDENIDMSKTGVAFKNQGKDRYNKKEEILERMFVLKDKEGNSFEEMRVKLVSEFGEDEVPKLTQLKNWYQEINPGQSANSLLKEVTDQFLSNFLKPNDDGTKQ